MVDYTQSQSISRSNVAVFMQQVYLWMTVALGVTAFSALFAASSPALLSIFFGNTFTMVVLMIGIFGLVFYLSSRIHTLSSGTATGLFLLYSVLMGIFLGPVLLIYTGASVAQTFLITAGTFGGMSVYGMVTKRDLTGMGNFLIMGLWGIILASIVNMFFGNSTVDLAISILGVAIFVGLTAYDTQKIAGMGVNAPLEDGTAIRRGALLGALTLYLDFINLFLYLLRFFGHRD